MVASDYPLFFFFLTGCGVPREHDPQFVGHWKSGLPITSVVPSTSRIGQGINNDIRQIHRANNASGAQGVRLEIRADGTFTMTVKFAIEDLKTLMKDLNIEDQKLSGSEDSYDGTWYSEGDAIVLTSDSFLPYAMTAVTRKLQSSPTLQTARDQATVPATISQEQWQTKSVSRRCTAWYARNELGFSKAVRLTRLEFSIYSAILWTQCRSFNIDKS